MDHADVVTAFLLRRLPGQANHPQEKDEILLTRRSERVGTYRGRWAGVSGFVEAPPEEQAYTEIWEETHLSRADARLLRRGEPLTFVDSDLHREWTVHPFLFFVPDSSKIQMDWESVESRWVAPQALDQYETVPMLREALARVYPPETPAQASASSG
ncbi:MAG TPA: NUDIX domain-containing protein [Ktedonobacterales bacterium]|jgi:ADP-ribose pyrophosphatase YjhB (NUDIX family)